MAEYEGEVFDPDRVARLPAECCTVAINPLLRELIIRAFQLPRLDDEHGPAVPLIQLLLDEFTAAPIERLHLPLPTRACAASSTNSAPTHRTARRDTPSRPLPRPGNDRHQDRRETIEADRDRQAGSHSRGSRPGTR